MGVLKKLGIVKNENSSSKIFEGLLGENFQTYLYHLPHEYVEYYWNCYKETFKDTSKRRDDAILKLIVTTLFVREGLLPLFTETSVTGCNGVKYDMLLCSEFNVLYTFSVKTRLCSDYTMIDLACTA